VNVRRFGRHENIEYVTFATGLTPKPHEVPERCSPNALEALTAVLFDYIPTVYDAREFVESGGLISYGINDPDVRRRLGIYTGKILRGTKPSDLPVFQPSKFELVINLKTAKTLGVDVPLSMQLLADEVIE